MLCGWPDGNKLFMVITKYTSQPYADFSNGRYGGNDNDDELNEDYYHRNTTQQHQHIYVICLKPHWFPCGYILSGAHLLSLKY